MALNEGSSFVVSSIISLLLFSGMQVYKSALASTQAMTILAGFSGSLLYVFLLTAVANLEKSIFGFNFQTKLGEVLLFNTKPFIIANHLCKDTEMSLNLILPHSFYERFKLSIYIYVCFAKQNCVIQKLILK